jgi:hypothetical protein
VIVSPAGTALALPTGCAAAFARGGGAVPTISAEAVAVAALMVATRLATWKRLRLLDAI